MRTAIAALLLAFSVPAPRAVSAASTPADLALPEVPPTAPAFDGWEVKTDKVLAREQIDMIQSKLGGKIKSLRNVAYIVNGRIVQLNVIVPQNWQEGDKIYKALASVKPPWAVARKPDALYEFVGPNDSIDDIKKAHDKLASP